MSENKTIRKETGDAWFSVHCPTLGQDETYLKEVLKTPIVKQLRAKFPNFDNMNDIEKVTNYANVVKGNHTLERTLDTEWADTPIVDYVAISYLKNLLRTLGVTNVFINIYQNDSPIDGPDKKIVLPTAEGVNRTGETETVQNVLCAANRDDCLEIKLIKDTGHYNALVRSGSSDMLKIINYDQTIAQENDMIKRHASLS